MVESDCLPSKGKTALIKLKAELIKVARRVDRRVVRRVERGVRKKVAKRVPTTPAVAKHLKRENYKAIGLLEKHECTNYYDLCIQ